MNKLVAFLCASLLAFASPVIAFAEDSAELSTIKWEGAEQLPSPPPRNESVTWNAGNGIFDAGTITGLTITFAADTHSPDAATKGWNIGRSLKEEVGVPSSVQGIIKPLDYKTLYTTTFELILRDLEKNPTSGDKTLGLISPDGGTMSFDFAPSSALINEYKAKVKSPSNLQYSLYAVPTGGSAVTTLATDKPVTQSTHVTVPTQTTIFVLALTDASKKPPVSVNRVSDDSDSDSDSPSMRDIRVEGSTEVSVRGDLNGPNVSDSDDVYLSIKRLSSGAAFEELRAAAGGDNLDKAYDVTLYVNGKVVHDGFGRLLITFDVGTQYNGRRATVWHLHDDGSLTHDDTWVFDGKVTVEATDLSAFGVDIEGVSSQVDDGTTSPKTGQDIPAATAPLALGVAGALGVATLLVVRRRVR